MKRKEHTKKSVQYAKWAFGINRALTKSESQTCGFAVFFSYFFFFYSLALLFGVSFFSEFLCFFFYHFLLHFAFSSAKARRLSVLRLINSCEIETGQPNTDMCSCLSFCQFSTTMKNIKRVARYIRPIVMVLVFEKAVRVLKRIKKKKHIMHVSDAFAWYFNALPLGLLFWNLCKGQRRIA